MSERGAHRGGGRGGGGGDRGGGNFRGGRGGGGRGGAQGGHDRERPKKENILDLAKYMDKQITVKFNGGREGNVLSTGRVVSSGDCFANGWVVVKGTLKGYDALMNLVLDDVEEVVRGTQSRPN